MTSNNNNNQQQFEQLQQQTIINNNNNNNNNHNIVQQLAMQQMNNMNPILKDYKHFQHLQNGNGNGNGNGNDSSGGEPSDLDNTNLYIKGLWKDCTQVELDDLFKQFGVISQSRVYGDGVGFVRFEQGFEAKAAIDKMDKVKLDRCQDVLLVKYAFKKQRNSKRYIREVEMIMNKNTNNVYLRCLPRGFNEKQLTELCSPYGELTCTRLRESGVAFVRFRKPEDAQKAIRALNGQRFDGHNETLLAKLANSDPFQPKIGVKSGQQQPFETCTDPQQQLENDQMSSIAESTNTMTPSQQSQPQLNGQIHAHMHGQIQQHIPQQLPPPLAQQQQLPPQQSYMIPQYQQYTYPQTYIQHGPPHHYQQPTQYQYIQHNHPQTQLQPQQTHYYDNRYYQPQLQQPHMQSPLPQPYPHNYTDPNNGYNQYHYVHTQYPPQPYPPHGPPPPQYQPYQQPQYVVQPTPINTKVSPQQISPSTVPSNANTVPSTVPPVPSTNTPTSVIIDTQQGPVSVVINTTTPSKEPLVTAPSYMPTNTNNKNNMSKKVPDMVIKNNKIPLVTSTTPTTVKPVLIPQVYYPGIGSPPASELSFGGGNTQSVDGSSIAHAVDGIISMVIPKVAVANNIKNVSIPISPGYINGNTQNAWRSAAANVGTVSVIPVTVPQIDVEKAMQNLTIIPEPKVIKKENNKENIEELNDKPMPMVRDSSNPHGVSRVSANQLHEVITVWYPHQAGKLTGMFLQNHDQEKVTKYLNRPQRLKKKIDTFSKLLSTKTQVTK